MTSTHQPGSLCRRVISAVVLLSLLLVASAATPLAGHSSGAEARAPTALLMAAVFMPKRKPGDEPISQDLTPKPKPSEEEAAPEPEEEEKPSPPPTKPEAKPTEEAPGFVWNERDQQVTQTIQGIGRWVLIFAVSAILAAAFGLGFWTLKLRSWILLLFVATAWIFEFYAIGMRFSVEALAFLGVSHVPAAIMGIGASIMLGFTLARRLPKLFRRFLVYGFGLFFVLMLAGILLAAPVDPSWVSFGFLAAVPFVLYGQVYARGRGLGGAFSFGLFLLNLSILLAAAAPLFINTGPGAPVPLVLHGVFLAGLAFLIIPPRTSDEFTEDFYQTEDYDREFAGTPRAFEEPTGFTPRYRSFDDDDGSTEEPWEDEWEEDWEEEWETEAQNEPRFGSFDDWDDEVEDNDYASLAEEANLGHLEEDRGWQQQRAGQGFRSSPPEPAPPSFRQAPAAQPQPVRGALGGEDRYALGVAGAHQGLWDWNIERDELYLSPSVDGMLGLASGGMIRSEVGWAERVHPDDFHAYRDALRTYIARGNASFDLEFRIRHQSGDYVWMKLSATCVPDETGMAARCVGTVTDISAEKAAYDRLNQAADRDPLTGLANRTALTHRLDEILASTHAPQDLPSLVVIDLDRFKTVNDSLGQRSGDALLQTVARRLEDVVGNQGLVARLGSDEFAILVYKQAGVRPNVVAAQALDTMAQPVELAGHEVFPMASLGLAEATVQHRRSEDLLKDAETAMFRAKRQGGGSVEVYVPTMSHQTIEALSLETDLRRALERQQMEVLFQPIMDFRTERVAGFEALLRWRHPTHGLMTPDQFVGMAEATDMIVPLGRFVLSMASYQLAQWQRLFPVSPPLFVSVNVSSRQLKRVDFADDVREVLETAHIQPGTLKLEVTESLIQEDPMLAENLLREVQALGAGIVLDDFGTGFASLSNLQRYPFDTIKVDRSFVSTMDSRQDSHVIVNSIVTLANDLGLTVVAEGLESEDDKHRIRQMGCDFGQGFVFGPPMSAMDAQNFIAYHWS